MKSKNFSKFFFRPEKKKIVENEENLDAHAKRLKDLYSSLANDEMTKAYQESLQSVREKQPEEKKFEGKTLK